MSHLTCDRVELSPYSTGKFIQCGFCSGLGCCWGGTIVCEHIHAYWRPWVTASDVGISTGTIGQTVKICWNVWSACTACFQRTERTSNMNFPPGVFRKKYDDVDVRDVTEDTYHHWTTTAFQESRKMTYELDSKTFLILSKGIWTSFMRLDDTLSPKNNK